MEMRAHYILIGSVVMILIAAAFWFVLWIGSGQREFDSYDVIFKERVTGLSVGSIVRFNGIQKGEVESLSIDQEDPSIVIARVRVDKDTPIKVDTTAELEPVGFTGLAIIQFVGGSAGAPLLKEESDARVPKIEADTSGIAMLLQSSGDIVARVNDLLSDENIEYITRTLENVEAVTGAIASNSEDISLLITNASKAAEDLSLLIADLKSSADGLEQLLNEDAPGAVQNADALIADARALVIEVEGAIEENREALRYFTDQGLGQVAPLLAEARRVMNSLDYILRDLERDPKAFLLGESTPEYEGEAD